MKWRPSLWFVVMGGLGGTLVVAFLGLVALRGLGPEIGYREAATLLACGIAAATAVLGWLLVRLLLRPVESLAAYARAARGGGAADPPAHLGTRELRGLADDVIGMGAALRGREAAIRTYTDHVTHELKTPVTAIRAAVELLEDGPDPGLLAQVAGAAAQIEDQLRALRAVAAAREPGHQGRSCLNEVAEGLRRAHPDLDLAVEGGAVPLPLAPTGLGLVLGHLLRNAAEAGAGRVRLAAAPGGLRVEDDGPGVAEGNAGRIFDPFFTTRREAGGTGMGLAIVRALLETHGWSVRRVDGPGLALSLDAPDRRAPRPGGAGRNPTPARARAPAPPSPAPPGPGG